jgi:hypothetical protein
MLSSRCQQGQQHSSLSGPPDICGAKQIEGRGRLPILAPNGHADWVEQCPLSGAKRKTLSRLPISDIGLYWPAAGAARMLDPIS